MDPIDIQISSGTVSRTITDIPVGSKTITIELKNSSNVALYRQHQAVTIRAGETTRPTFNNFIAENESIVITSPNGGESWKQGSQHSIIWNGSHPEKSVKIRL